jgi:hypothetical protein
VKLYFQLQALILGLLQQGLLLFLLLPLVPGVVGHPIRDALVVVVD